MFTPTAIFAKQPLPVAPPLPDMPTDGLLWWFDFSDTNSYPGTGTVVDNLSTDPNTGGDQLNLTGGTYTSEGTYYYYDFASSAQYAGGTMTYTGSVGGSNDFSVVQVGRLGSAQQYISTFFWGTAGFEAGYSGWTAGATSPDGRIAVDLWGDGPTFGANTKAWTTTSNQMNFMVWRKASGNMTTANTTITYPDGVGGITNYTGGGIDVLASSGTDTPNITAIDMGLNGYNTSGGGGGNLKSVAFLVYDREITDAECQDILDYYTAKGITLV